MRSLQTLIPSLTKLLVVFILLSLGMVILKADDLPAEFDGLEREALYALKATFNNSLLNKSWNGLPCYMDRPPLWIGIRCLNGRVTGILLKGLGLKGWVNVNALVNLTELSILSFENNWISGNIMDFSSNKKLRHIDLSGNMFDGPISSSLLGLNVLESLQLQGNNLTGQIPGFRQVSLIEFNVSINNLSGKIPQTNVLQSFSYSSFFGNPSLCGLPSPFICDEKKEKKNFFRRTSWVVIFVVFDVIVLVCVMLLFILCYKNAKKVKKEIKKEVKEMDVVAGKEKINEKKMESREVKTVGGKEERGNLTFMDGGGGFELNDLLRASAEGLGKGNLGNAYKAMLENGLDVVVKRVRDMKPLSMEEFDKRVRAIADLKHPNLLPLLAYYYSKDEPLLIYKFAPCGNLFNRIHGGRGRNRIPFKWNSRLSVALGVARAIDFMHLNTNSHATILHGNLKSPNVLLDENEVPLVSDYGLTLLIPLPVAAQWMTSYKSPENQQRQKISKKSDVWSYGCLLLELLTGRISTSSAPEGVNGVDLGSWVHRAIREEWTAELFDPEISLQRNATKGMLKLLQIATRCCHQSPEMRPNMREVVREVEDIKIIDSEDDNTSFDLSLTEDSLSGNGSQDWG